MGGLGYSTTPLSARESARVSQAVLQHPSACAKFRAGGTSSRGFSVGNHELDIELGQTEKGCITHQHVYGLGLGVLD